MRYIIGISLFYFLVLFNNFVMTHESGINTTAYGSSEVWIYSILSTALISVAPVLVIFLIPDLKNRHSLLKILLSFAVGGLLGDTFLHLIPHALHPHSHDGKDHAHGHSHGSSSHNMHVGLWVVAGILSFLCVEKFVRLVKGNHGHSHSIKQSEVHITENSEKSTLNSRNKSEGLNVKRRKVGDKPSVGSNDESPTPSNLENIKVSGYLNLVADFTHNFTDGLAIGASFLVNKNVGIVTTITILFHEIPHEIGDYAILIQSGCSKKKAILLQLVTAIGAMSGTIISLISSGWGNSSQWILPYTAGGFIYIATVTVLPELIEANDNSSADDSKSDKRRSNGMLQTLAELTAICIGVGMMALIAFYE